MKNLLQFISVTLGGYLASQFLPWYIIGVIAVIAAFLFHRKPGISFAICWLGGFILWFVWGYYLSAANEHLLSGRIGTLFGGLDPIVLLLVTGIIGGMTAGLGGYTGSLIRSLLLETNNTPHHGS